ncbi:nudix (nucleoside diphosphate linked moiety X)-type motif 2 [Blyttiomyces sp. JEL0837]|nr:nudix (nucleoside diphosphate linked moiety X)-type motif 2 [Blyttiomyces sp. JEL0837]
MEAVRYAGVILYRIQRSTEFLLLNDSYSNKRHWAPPKGKIIGSEDEVKCALRETADITGLSAKSIVIDEPTTFRVEIKYLSGTTPKHVIFYVGHISSKERIAPGGMAGLHMAWFSLNQAMEKSIYKNMQDVLKKAHTFIEEMRAKAPPPTANNGVGVPRGIGSRQGQPGQQGQGQQQGAGRGGRGGALSAGAGGRFRQNGDGNGSKDEDGSGNGNGNGNTRSARDKPGRSPLVFAPNGNSKNWRARGLAAAADGGDAPIDGDDTVGTEEAGRGGLRLATSGGFFEKKSTGGVPQSLLDNPLYKTRLCERFETEGSCPYGVRCTFAHGTAELRDRSTFGGEHDGTASPTATTPGVSVPVGTTPTTAAENPLYKTKLCERFMKENFCQYGPRCNFAHSQAELRERPAGVAASAAGTSNPDDGAIAGVGNSTPFNSSIAAKAQKERAAGLEESGNGTRGLQLRPSGGKVVGNENQTVAAVPMPAPAASTTVVIGSKPNVVAAVVGKKEKAGGSVKKNNDSVSLKEMMSDRDKTTKDKSAKVIEIGKISDQDRLAPPSNTGMSTTPVDSVSPAGTTRSSSPAPAGGTSPSPVNKALQLTKHEETVIAELRKFFKADGVVRTLAEETKEITRLEFKHDLSKLQVFNVLIGSLFEEEYAVVKLKERKKLIHQFIRSTNDQTLFLRSWDRAMNRNAELMKKAALVFKDIYDTELVDEEVFLAWYDGGAPGISEAVKVKCMPLVEWLKTAEEEDGEE